MHCWKSVIPAMVTHLLFIYLNHDFQLSKVHSRGKSKTKENNASIQWLLEKNVASTASGIWKNYLCNFSLLPNHIKSVSKLLWFAAAVCIRQNLLAASYFSKQENTSFWLFSSFKYANTQVGSRHWQCYFRMLNSIELSVLALRKHIPNFIDINHYRNTIKISEKQIWVIFLARKWWSRSWPQVTVVQFWHYLTVLVK